MDMNSTIISVTKNGNQYRYFNKESSQNRVNIRLCPKEMAWLRLLSKKEQKSMSAIARNALREVFRKEGFYGY
jgi:hypothetical protein